MRIFGRDPAAWTAAIAAVLALLLSFDKFGLTSENVALIMAAVTAFLGLVTAFYTKRAGLAAAIGFTKAALALAAGYGLALTTDQTSGVIMVVTVVLGLFGWTQNEPATDPGFREEYTQAA